MPNILSVPSSGSIYFSSGISGSPTIPSLASGVALRYDSGAGLNVTSYSTGFVDRFSVDGSAGRLFYISDSLTGVIFSVNDAAGLPIIEVNSTTGDVITMGTYGQNTLVVSGNNVGVGVKNPAYKLDVSGQIHSVGAIFTDDASTTRTNLGLGATNDVQFNSLYLSSGLSVARTANVSGLNVTGTASVGSLYTTAGTLTGPSNVPMSLGAGYQTRINARNGVTVAVFDAQNPPVLSLRNGTAIGWTDGEPGADIGTMTLSLYKDSADAFAQRRGSNAQTFRLYNTYSSTTGFERLNFRWSSNIARIGTEKGSAAGTARDLILETDATERMRISSSGDISVNNNLSVSGYVLANNLLYATGDQNISGLKSFYTRPEVSGTGVLLQGELETGNFITQSQTGEFYPSYNPSGFITGIDNIVYTTGNQAISGEKSFLSNLFASGNVGIGTTSPAYKLDVSGQIHSVGAIFTDDASTTRTNLGLGTTNNVTFNKVTVNYANGYVFDSDNAFIKLDSSTMKFYNNGIERFGINRDSDVVTLRNGGIYRWSSTTNVSSTTSSALEITNEGNDVLAQRRSTNPQTFRLYRSYTSSSVYQRLTLNTAASGFNIAAESTSVSNVDLNLLPQGSGKTKTTALEATTDVQVVGGNYEVDFSSLYGSALQLRVNETLVTPVTGSFATASRIIPSGALVLGAVIRVVNGISGDIGTSFSIGDGIDTDKWGNGISFASGTTTNGTNFNTLLPSMYPTGSDVILTPDSGTFTTGQVRVAVHYMSFTAPSL